MRLSRWIAVTFLLAFLAPVSAQEKFFFKKGDVIVVMGDSITEQRLYSNYLETWSVTRFPEYKLVFRNVGIGGDRSVGGNGRFKRDVLPYKPSVLTVDFGMNDGGYRAFADNTFDPYMKGLQGIADQAKAAGIRVAWITPQPVEHNPGDPKESYNDTLEKFSAGVKQIAEKNSGSFADQFHPYWAVIKKSRDEGGKGRITAGDAVHPGSPGQSLMAASILKGLHFPREVSSVTIDVASGAETSTNCKVTIGNKSGSGVSFTRADQALPFFPDQAKSILKWAPLLDEMNHYGLTVKGLKAGNYAVKLGGTKVADYSAEQLAAGVNLADAALSAGPVAEQVMSVVKAVTDKTNYFHDKIFRGVVLANVAKDPAFKDVNPKELAAKKEAMIAERMKMMPELDAAIHAASQPRAYQVEIVAAEKK
jgi:lysophospholipase L1-like esterase